MEILVLGVVTGIVILAGYALAHAWRRVMRDDAPLPIYGMLKRRNVQPADESAMVALAQAARRCAFCSLGEECRRRVAAGEPAPVDCPNADLWLSRPAA